MENFSKLQVNPVKYPGRKTWRFIFNQEMANDKWKLFYFFLFRNPNNWKMKTGNGKGRISRSQSLTRNVTWKKTGSGDENGVDWERAMCKKNVTCVNPMAHFVKIWKNVQIFTVTSNNFGLKNTSSTFVVFWNCFKMTDLDANAALALNLKNTLSPEANVRKQGRRLRLKF